MFDSVRCMPTEKPRFGSGRPLGARINPNSPGQVGRRPPNPVVPLLTGVMWIIVGVVIVVWFDAGWRFVVGFVCIGVGGLFVRGGLAALIRRSP
jgi:hypothetical protein